MVRITNVFMVGCLYRFLGGLGFRRESLGNNPLLCRQFLGCYGFGLLGWLRQCGGGLRQCWGRWRWGRWWWLGSMLRRSWLCVTAGNIGNDFPQKLKIMN